MEGSTVSFNGLTFVQNLQNVTIKEPGSLSNIKSILLNGFAGGNQTVADGFFQQYNKNTNPLPLSLGALVSTFRAYATAHGVTSTTTQQNLVDAITKDYVTNVNGPGSQSSDWSLISPQPTATDMQNQAEAWFNDFLNNFTYQTTGSVSTLSDFIAAGNATLTTTAALQNGATLYQETGTTTTSPITLTLPTFQSIYQAFFPNGNFAQKLNAFYQDEVAKSGYFSPSQALDDWTRSVGSDYVTSLAAGNFLTPSSSLSSGGFQKTIILNQIFVLVASMLNTMQRVAAIQANRLQILTQWQQAFTNELSQIHVFLQSDGTTLADKPQTAGNTDPNASKKATIRQELNNNINSINQTNLQNQQSVIADDAKALQSNLNQSNDQVSQQANLGTTIIQDLQTILSAIYH